GLLPVDGGHVIVQSSGGELGTAVGEGDVYLVHVALKLIEVVAHAGVGTVFKESFTFELGEAEHRWGLTLALIDEDESEVLLARIATDANPLAEGLRLGWLLDTLATAIVRPAVVEAPNVVALHPP